MKKLSRIYKNCKLCRKRFEVRITSDRKFCSRKCYGIDWANRAVNFKKDFKKGHTPWNKGKKLEYKPHFNMQGRRVSSQTEFKYKNGAGAYVVLHRWVRKKFGKPNFCSLCKSGDKKIYQWANISGEYKRDITDWVGLCVSCHKRFDIGRYWRKHKDFYENAVILLKEL